MNSEEQKVTLLLNTLTALVLRDAAPFIRRRSLRFSIHAFPKKSGGFAYFEYDKRKKRVTKLLSEREARFFVGEQVTLIQHLRVCKRVIIQIIPKGKSPSDYADCYPEFNHQRIFHVYRYFFDDTYLCQSGNRLYWHSIKHLRKVEEYASTF